MKFVEDYRWAIDMIMHPSLNTKKSMTLEQSFATYYKVSLIPLLILVIAEIAVGNLVSTFLSAIFTASSTLAPLASWIGAGVVLLAVLTIVFAWIMVPIGLLVDAIIYYVFGKYIFKTFTGTFEGMVTAMVYGIMPVVVLSWLFIIPILGFPLLFGISALWEIIVLVYATANQQKTTPLKALLTVVGSWVVLWILQVIVFFFL